ncbi:MAG TPA: hypothetical protein VMV68_08905, partial [Spirochaetia bacterium]|nr:hypothetical protein [Spirochaetia bacterium]
MGKISVEAKRRYFDRIKEYKASIDAILHRETSLVQALKSDDKGADQKRLALADEYLDLVSYHVLMNSLSVSLLGVKNEAFLNDAR